ncbi:Lrp/AsnC family transcriptional regulator [Pseudonocardia halophobica]|uniref:Lrp/AsnC family transcriptional regulator n=1 Tax=Pseudonocardia halophobica TaxID=29401 RepID=UPI003D8B6433
MQVSALSDKELQLVHALQVWPRAPWSRLGPVLDVDPVTLARRWSDLVRRGAAWITCQPAQRAFRHGAVVEVECLAGAAEDVVGEVSRDRACLSVEVVSGARTLMLTVSCADAAELSAYLIRRLDRIPGVRAVRANPVLSTIKAGEEWRLTALSPAQVGAVEEARRATPAPAEAVRGLGPDELRTLVAILCRDGRATSKTIADGLGVPHRRARSYVQAAVAGGAMEFRTDVAQRLSGRPVSAWFFLRVPAIGLREVGTRLRALRPVWSILSVAGPSNLLVHVRVQSAGEIEGLEIALHQALPSLVIADRSLVLAVRKRIGRTFDQDEAPSGVVPWEPLLPRAGQD